MQICLWKKIAPFHSTVVTAITSHSCSGVPISSACSPLPVVPLQLFGKHTGNQTQADEKEPPFAGSPPAPGAAVPAQLRSPGSDGAAATQGRLKRTSVHMGCALRLPVWKTRGFLNRNLHFLAYSPAAQCHVQKSQASAVAVSWLGNYPARSGLSILRTFKFAACVGLKRERRAGSPGGRLRTAIPLQMQAGEKPQHPSVLPPSKQMGTRAEGPPLCKPEWDKGGCSWGGSQTKPKPPSDPPFLAVFHSLYFFLAEHHFTYAQKGEQKTWTNYKTN